ncbi:MAG: Tex family protein [Parachlamydiales bacterium]|jgi:uncharacterized protein
MIKQIAAELSLPEASVKAVLNLFGEGNTVPFIARYRKEATGNLDEVAIRAIQDRDAYLKDFYERREVIIQSIESQGKLTDQIKAGLLKCTTKQELEDIYLPYKPKRRTRAMIAREKGLEPLAAFIIAQTVGVDMLQTAESFIDSAKGVENSQDALAGARDIVAENFAEIAAIRSQIRSIFFEKGIVTSKVLSGKETEGAKFQQYFEFNEPLSKIPSHRYLAIRRGEAEDVLLMQIDVPEAEILEYLKHYAGLKKASPFAEQLELALRDSLKRLLLPSLETDVRVQKKMEADQEAVKVFSDNLGQLLMAAPLGEKTVVGIDPGLRTGCKCASVNAAGKFLETMTFYLHNPDETKLKAFLNKHKPFAIAIGNGTASRETETFILEVIKNCSFETIIVMVSEAGASVYSASDIARQEFPDLDLTIRGAISIARRLQDPLAELVKVDPKSIGVGQYQHDVHQPLLQQKLTEVVESCVNNVGVELNTASAPLLSYVAGIGPSLAEKIVRHRESEGVFRSRNQLLKVGGFGPKTFLQAAGFLRLHQGENPLDASAVHPERYPLVEKMAQDIGVQTVSLIGNQGLIAKIDIKKYVQGDVGEPTLRDILDELRKPGRDPRAVFEPPKFRQDVRTIDDVTPGMQLEGVITNVTAFGAFVDIGVHQDGLLHISELADHYVKDPSQEVSVGQKVTVKVLEVDKGRKRISLTRKTGVAVIKSQKAPAQASPKKPSHNPFANL